MDPSSSLFFRPSLIICVGKTGELIREHLSPSTYHHKTDGTENFERMADGEASVYHLLANVDDPLQQSVGLLQIVTEGKTPHPDIAIPLPPTLSFPKDPAMPKEPGDLENVIRAALRSVQLDSRMMNIKSQQYAIPNTRTQIFIVGEQDDINTSRMAKILGILRKATPDYHFDSPVCYFLNCNNVPGDHSTKLNKPRGAALNWSRYELANFSYLFEPVIPYPSPTFLMPNEMQYATAETLFALVATGITSIPEFENEMQLSLTLENYSDHVGSFSTSMIQFPHPAVRRYCSALLTADLMEEWHHTHEISDISDAGRSDLKGRAQGTARNIWEWMRDSVERPAAAKSLWPSLAVLLQSNHPRGKKEMVAHREALLRLRELTERLFTYFSDEEVEEISKGLKKSKSWSDVANECSDRAVGFFPAWERQARMAWEAASARIDAEIRRDVDDFWENDDDGFEKARIFVDELDDRLVDIANETVRWRQEHEASYKSDREDYREKSIGEWNITENQSNIIGDNIPPTVNLRPTMGGQAPVPGAQFGPAVMGSGGGSSSGGAGKGPQHLPPDEEQIALNLGGRVSFKKGLVPSTPTLFGAGFLGWLGAVLTMQMFNVPSSANLVLNGGLALLVALGCVSLRMRRDSEFKKAQHDALAFYRRYYVRQCERREDLERISLLRFVKGKVYQMRDRLDHLSQFFQSMEDQARQEAERVVEMLFDGPGGVRDILIANGERLQKTGPHTLQSIANQVTTTRLNRPLEHWHSSLSAMKSELIVQLRDGPKSLLGMEEKEVQEKLYTFMADVVSGYLIGSLVNINAALDKPDIWREIQERVSKPMYFASVGLRDPYKVFVCGCSEDLTKSALYLRPDTVQILTRSKEWLIVAALFKGGEPTKLNADKLFPLKTVSASTSGSAPLSPVPTTVGGPGGDGGNGSSGSVPATAAGSGGSGNGNSSNASAGKANAKTSTTRSKSASQSSSAPSQGSPSKGRSSGPLPGTGPLPGSSGTKKP